MRCNKEKNEDSQVEAETIEDDIGEEGFTKKQIEEVKQKL